MENNMKRSSADDHKSGDDDDNNDARVNVSDDALNHHHHHHHQREVIVQEQNRALSYTNHREYLLFPKTTETTTTTSIEKRQSLSVDSDLTELSLCHRQHIEEKKSALSDDVLKGYLLPKTSETTTKKRQASVDLDFMDRVRRQRVERGCYDRCGFKLFGCDANCKHTNNNIKEDKTAPQMMNMPSTSSSAQNNQERENSKMKTKPHLKPMKQKKQFSTPHLLPRAIVNDIISKGGRDIQHIGTKKLMETDIDKHQNRLNVINPDALMNALTPQERDRVTGAQYRGLEVEMMDATGRKYSMNIRRRTCNGAAVINRQWSKLVSDNGLSRDDVVQLWGYRRSDGGFSLVLIDAINGESWFCDRCGIRLFGRYILLRNCNHQNDDILR